MRGWKKRIGDFARANSFLVRPFLMASVIYLVGILAIILAGVHYADDIGRTERGYAAWANFSRYINEILSRFVHADNYLTNIAPLPQILAVLILAVTSVMLIYIVVGKDRLKQPWKKWAWLVTAVVPLGLSPYMLECLSYQYDAIYMALSVFFVLMPFVFREGNLKQYLIAVVIGILGTCMTYQAVLGVFPMMIVFLALDDWSKKKKFAKRTGATLLIFGVVLIVFQKFLMIPRELYVSNSLPSLQDYVPETLKHLGQYFDLLINDFKIWWLVIIGVIAVMFVILFIKNSRRNKILAGVVGVGGLAVMTVCAFVMYASLSAPLFAPRSMYAVGVLLAIICVYAVDNLDGVVLKIPVFVLSWCFVVFALTYGNALGEQDRYRDMKIDMVMADLNGLKIMQNEETKNIQVVGDVGKSPIIMHMPKDYQMLNRLLSSSYNEGLIWTTYRLVYLCDIGNLQVDPELDLTKLDLPVVKSTVYYDISADENNVLVRFKEGQGRI